MKTTRGWTRRERLTLIASGVALALSLTALLGFEGVSIAGNGGRKITSGQIRNNTIRSVDIRNNTITGKDVANGTLTAADSGVYQRLGFSGSIGKDETGQAIATCANGDVAVGADTRGKARSPSRGFRTLPTSGSTRRASRTPRAAPSTNGLRSSGTTPPAAADSRSWSSA